LQEKERAIKTSVIESYSSLAKGSELGTCCDTSKTDKLVRYGYSAEELASLPESVIAMSDGCGNPTGLGMIKEGNVVLDLGSGGGIDVLLASKKVGKTGRVIGLDMTPEMVIRATATAKRMGVVNVEFKLGEIEKIPLGDESVDVIMSNCVICLSPEKEKVFQEMSRVLRKGGALAIADEVAVRPFTEEEKGDPGKWCSCITGAVTESRYRDMLEDAGFTEVYVKQLRPSMSGPSQGVFSAFVSAVKPLN
jgi:arsenite methyltransferase